MAFARWDPIHDLLAIQQRLDRFAPGHAGWKPPVDLHETPDRYVVTAELPGLSRQDLQIDIQDSVLTLSGERRARGSACEAYHRVERGYGAFSRSFQLPIPIQVDAVTADLRDGILTVVCPKSPDAAARRIRIT